MSPFSVLLLAMSMSADAFAVSVGRGTKLGGTRASEALRTGLVFGIVEAATPFLGWLAGVAAADWVSHFDHWLAFGLLALVGLHMIHGACTGAEESTGRFANTSFVVLLATAVGTSIDAMAVGLSLALLGMSLNGIVVVSLAIGAASFGLATAGLMLGKAVGNQFGKFAEILAGLVLCALGLAILLEHMTA
mgnify:FL=1